MAIKIEIVSTIHLPKRTQSILDSALESLPREHLRGIERVRVVDFITDARVRNLNQKSELPGLYHPKQGNLQPWIEVAAGVLLPSQKSFIKRIMPRLSFKGNVAAVVFSLVGQHYYLTLRHSMKRGQIEPAVRAYTEKQLKNWQEKEHKWRSRVFKPIQPTLERWGRALQKKAKLERKRTGS